MPENTSPPRSYKILLGCAFTLLMLVVILAVGVVTAFQRDQARVHYPQATPVFTRSNYSQAPLEFRWSGSYLTDDAFYDVRDWYVREFEMTLDSPGAECQSMHQRQSNWLLNRRITVIVCEYPSGQEISITRSTRLGR